KSTCLLVLNGILAIASQSIGKKDCFSLCISQHPVVLSIRSLTILILFPCNLDIGLISPSLGIQFIAQMSVASPVPMRRINPWHNTSLPSTIALQILDGDVPI